MGLTTKYANLICSDDCEQAFLTLMKALFPATVLLYLTRDGPFILSMYASEIGMGSVLEQKQEDDGRVVKRLLPMPQTLNVRQWRYCTTNRELLTVVTAVNSSSIT